MAASPGQLFGVAQPAHQAIRLQRCDTLVTIHRLVAAALLHEEVADPVQGCHVERVDRDGSTQFTDRVAIAAYALERQRQIVMVVCYARSELNRLYQGIHRCLDTVGVQMRQAQFCQAG